MGSGHGGIGTRQETETRLYSAEMLLVTRAHSQTPSFLFILILLILRTPPPQPNQSKL